MGSRDDCAEYDYADGLTLNIYQLADGATAQRTICDAAGNILLTATAKRQGDTITVRLNGKKDTVTVQQIGTDCRLVVE